MERFRTSALLYMYDKLRNNGTFIKSDIAEKFNITERTVSRYINDLRNYLAQENTGNEIIYNSEKGVYELQGKENKVLNEKDVLSISKVLLESRGFCKDEMHSVINKLLYNCISEDKKVIENIIGNESDNYVPAHHGKKLIDKLWDISLAISEQKIIEIEYFKLSTNGKLQKEPSKRSIKPLSILFSEYYFYLAAFIEGTEYQFPTIYRIDRIESFTITNKTFSIDYSHRFQDGEFRKLIQFMQTGNLKRIIFKFTGSSIEAVLDRLPNAKILKEKEGEYIIEVQMFDEGIKMWLLSQGDSVEVLSPKEFRDEMKETIEKMRGKYFMQDEKTYK